MKIQSICWHDDSPVTEISDHLIVHGKTAEGYVVVSSPDFPELWYGLTPCCHASAKGSWDEANDLPAVVCRTCYRPVSWSLGGEMTLDDIVVTPAVIFRAIPDAS